MNFAVRVPLPPHAAATAAQRFTTRVAVTFES
jgi:hypothetical protein